MGVSEEGAEVTQKVHPPEPIGRLSQLLDELREQLAIEGETYDEAYEALQDIGRRKDAIEIRIRVLEDCIYCFSVQNPKRKLVGDRD